MASIDTSSRPTPYVGGEGIILAGGTGSRPSAYLDTPDGEWYKLRLTGMLLCFMGAFLILFLRLFYLQLIEGEELRRLSESNCIRLESIDAPRGLIFDRKGRLLVDNRPAFDLNIILKDAKPLEETLQQLSEILQIPFQELKARINRRRGIAAYKPLLLKQDIGRDTLAMIEARRFYLPGVVINVAPRRNYIDHGRAAHVIGYLGEIGPEQLRSEEYAGCRAGDYIGKFGIEKAFESRLRGDRGGRQVEVNAKGQVVRVLNTVDARPGYNLYLTLDQVLQQRAESLLEGKAGAVVAMDPFSGHILAMASSPQFDQNEFVSGMSAKRWRELVSNPYRPLENKATQAEYPPASTYKIITALAGLEEGVIDGATTIFCPGSYAFGDRVFRCWKKGGHGAMDLNSAIAQSCDVYFYQVGQRLGVDRLAWYAKACGLGAPTGFALDREASGLIPTASWKKLRTGIPWQAGETLSVAIGQGYDLATPLQMLIVISSIANGGTRVEPMVLDRIETAEGEVLDKRLGKQKGKIPIKPETLQMIRSGLWETVNGDRGTGRIARLKGVEICGKTGTAQIVSRPDEEDTDEADQADHLKAHAWFVGYAPAEAPKIAVAALVEHGEHGSSAAGPVVREMVRTYLSDEYPELVSDTPVTEEETTAEAQATDGPEWVAGQHPNEEG